MLLTDTITLRKIGNGEYADYLGKRPSNEIVPPSDPAPAAKPKTSERNGGTAPQGDGESEKQGRSENDQETGRAEDAAGYGRAIPPPIGKRASGPTIRITSQRTMRTCRKEGDQRHSTPS